MLLYVSLYEWKVVGPSLRLEVVLLMAVAVGLVGLYAAIKRNWARAVATIAYVPAVYGAGWILTFMTECAVFSRCL